MKGHALHFSWLHGVVPDGLVVGCHSFDCTSMSQMFQALSGKTFPLSFCFYLCS